MKINLIKVKICSKCKTTRFERGLWISRYAMYKGEKLMFWKWLRWQAQSYTKTWCSCHTCIGHWNCEFDGDLYNTNGDCLYLK